ncbi:DUF1295 domain-containing protein [archaeon]|nr:MAG: DUF1295 domain-containing protein [archaeon]
MREHPLRFLVFWVFQMAWVYIVSLPVTVLNATSQSCREKPGGQDVAGFLMAIAGLIIEVWADYDKLQFK